MLSALKDYLESISFALFCHDGLLFVEFDPNVKSCFLLSLEILIDADLIDIAHRRGAQLESHPLICLRYEELLLLKVRQKSSLRLAIRMRDIVTRYGSLSSKLTNFRHCL